MAQLFVHKVTNIEEGSLLYRSSNHKVRLPSSLSHPNHRRDDGLSKI